MASFKYEASTSAGRIEKGLIDADSVRVARGTLRARGLLPLRVEPVQSADASTATGSTRRLPQKDLTLLTRQLASLLTARLPLADALAVVQQQSEHTEMRELLATVRGDVVAGHRFSDALSRHPKAFPNVYLGMVAAGEQVGDLSAVLERLAVYLEERQALRAKLLTAFLYPTVVVSVALIIVVFLMAYVVPQVVEVFEHTRQTLPLPTRVLLAVSAFTRTGGPVLLVAMLVGVLALRRLLRQEGFRLSWDRQMLSIPVFGRLHREVETTRFASTLAILAQSGVPMLQALAAARATLRNTVLARAVDEATSRVREGAGLARSLDENKVFPPVLIHLVRSGEVTGDLGGMLAHAAAHLRRDVERRATALTALLEPLLILLMGVVVLAIVLAVLLPIIEINQTIR